MKYFIDMNLPETFSHYLFDLDNTLYRETDYLFPAFKEIAGIIASKTDRDAEEMARYLRVEFNQTGRKHLLNKMIEKFSITDTSITEMLHIMRTVNPGQIRMYADAYRTLIQLKNKNKKLAVITNGTVQQQKNKINHIEWGDLDGSIEFIFADETERKPSPASLNLYLKNHDLRNDQVVFIGDGVEDERAASSAKILFIKSMFKGE